MHIGLLWISTLLFVALKLAGVITWSWWLVFAPVWITALLVILLVIGSLAFLRRNN